VCRSVAATLGFTRERRLAIRWRRWTSARQLRSPNVDWVEAIGFQREAVHTGALRHLLGGSRAVNVARALTGDERISAVTDPLPEVKARQGTRRPVDLAADLRLGGNQGGRLSIEVKVDSAWTPGQLREAVAEEDHGLLLAVGYTALAIDHRDMEAMTGYRWPWRRVGPDALAPIVRAHANDDQELLGYADHLCREADDHARALEAVRNGTEVAWGREPRSLEHWAYFSEVIRYRHDAAHWERKALVSGPLMTLWVVDHDDGTGDYLEFMGEGARRSLCVKTWANQGSGLLRGNRDRLIDLLVDLGPLTIKAPRNSAKTCTAAKFPLDGVRPREAAALAETLVARLRV
jgi:hypothetical protein